MRSIFVPMIFVLAACSGAADLAIDGTTGADAAPDRETVAPRRDAGTDDVTLANDGADAEDSVDAEIGSTTSSGDEAGLDATTDGAPTVDASIQSDATSGYVYGSGPCSTLSGCNGCSIVGYSPDDPACENAVASGDSASCAQYLSVLLDAGEYSCGPTIVYVPTPPAIVDAGADAGDPCATLSNCPPQGPHDGCTNFPYLFGHQTDEAPCEDAVDSNDSGACATYLGFLQGLTMSLPDGGIGYLCGGSPPPDSCATLSSCGGCAEVTVSVVAYDQCVSSIVADEVSACTTYLTAWCAAWVDAGAI